MRTLKNFFGKSRTFSGVSFEGCYDMPLDHVHIMFNHFQRTGENLLDDYSNCYHIQHMLPEVVLDESDRAQFDNSLSRIRRIGLLSPEDVSSIQYNIREAYRRHQDELCIIQNQPRRDACAFTAKKSVRDAVFALHGTSCLACGATEDICLDHVIPVFNGGENSIDNLQPLCRSCNTKKGTDTTDYRTNTNG